MRKIVILLIIITLTGCSASRKLSRNVSEASQVSISDVLSKNVTSGSFIIPKCEIEVNTKDINDRFTAGIKYEYPGKYLVTLRTILGIELARVFISSDTILANDRINRNLYFGKPSMLAYKYGFPFDIFPLVFGDLVLNSIDENQKSNCSNNEGQVSGVVMGRKLSYMIDCRKRKIVNSVVEGSTGVDNANVIYSDFMDSNNMTVPGKVDITGFGGSNRITFTFDKIEPWSGVIEFIPGNRYNRIELK